jgi:hypothetical protein
MAKQSRPLSKAQRATASIAGPFAAWRDRVAAAWRPPIDLAWRGGRLLRRAAPGVAAAARPAPDVEALCAAIGALLAGQAHRRVRLQLGDDLGRLMHVPRPAGTRTPRELEAAIRARFEQLHGEPADGWTLRATALPRAAGDIVCALPSALLEALAGAWRAARVRCVSLRVDWVVAAAGAPRRGACWVLDVREDAMTLGWLVEGEGRGVRRLAAPMAGDDLATVLARARPLFGGVDAAVADEAPVCLSGDVRRWPWGDAAERVRVTAAEVGWEAGVGGDESSGGGDEPGGRLAPSTPRASSGDGDAALDLASACLEAPPLPSQRRGVAA